MGVFRTHIEAIERESVFRYRISWEGAWLTHANVLDLWAHGPFFRVYFSKLLAGSRFSAFRWETPALTLSSIHQPFEFVLLNAPGLACNRHQESAFARLPVSKTTAVYLQPSKTTGNKLGEALALASRRMADETSDGHATRDDSKGGIVAIASLDGDSTLIAPSPDAVATYGHLADFLRCASRSQTDALWRLVGETMKQELVNGPVWLSTAYLGVDWPHVRVDSRPKYYVYAPYKRLAA